MRTRARAWIGRAMAAVFVAVLSGCVLWVAPAVASEPSSIRTAIQPPFPDGYYAWRTGVTTIALVQERPGTLLYQWDSVLGPWSEYEGPLIAPEGKHVLFSRLILADEVGSLSVQEVKVDYDAPVRAMQPLDTRMTFGAESTGDGVAVTTELLPWAGTRIQRLGGADRYETSALISAANWDSADTVIIATGRNFADALSASGLSGCYDAPVLLTQPYGLPPSILAEIERLGAARAFIVGGPVAVGETVDRELGDRGVEVTRLGGTDRYHTAALVADEVVAFGESAGRVYVARGDGFADALALGPLAFATRAPLLLVRPTSLPDQTREALADADYRMCVMAGGEVAIARQVEQEVRTYVPSVVRVAGATRYETAGAVASYAVTNGIAEWAYVGIATGVNYADALCGGVSAGHSGGVILLTPPETLPAPTESRIASNIGHIEDIHLFGGTVAVTDGVLDQIHVLAE